MATILAIDLGKYKSVHSFPSSSFTRSQAPAWERQLRSSSFAEPWQPIRSGASSTTVPKLELGNRRQGAIEQDP
jgi:hypothetical protein